MIQKIEKKVAILLSALTLLVSVAIPAAVSAAVPTVDCSTQPSAPACQVKSGISGSLNCGSNAQVVSTPEGEKCATLPAENAPGGLSEKIKKVLNILSAVVGVVAVIMIIYGGFRYVASGGKQESVTAAKNTLLYAIVGLIIVALAQAIVHFVLRSTA